MGGLYSNGVTGTKWRTKSSKIDFFRLGDRGIGKSAMIKIGKQIGGLIGDVLGGLLSTALSGGLVATTGDGSRGANWHRHNRGYSNSHHRWSPWWNWRDHRCMPHCCWSFLLHQEKISRKYFTSTRQQTSGAFWAESPLQEWVDRRLIYSSQFSERNSVYKWLKGVRNEGETVGFRTCRISIYPYSICGTTV